jgi:hypothetical protein
MNLFPLALDPKNDIEQHTKPANSLNPAGTKPMKILFLFIPLMLVSVQCHALRCGNKIVNSGDSKYKILARCGEPDFVETREKFHPPGCNGYGATGFPICHVEFIEVWTYNFGPHKFIKELVFRDGVLKDINNLEYGY